MEKDTLHQANALLAKIEYWEKKKEQFSKLPELRALSIGCYRNRVYRQVHYDRTNGLLNGDIPIEPDFYEILLEEQNRAHHFMRARFQLEIDKLEIELKKL
jgi:hypothetical protein